MMTALSTGIVFHYFHYQVRRRTPPRTYAGAMLATTKFRHATSFSFRVLILDDFASLLAGGYTLPRFIFAVMMILLLAVSFQPLFPATFHATFHFFGA